MISFNFHKTALYGAVEGKNIEIIKILLNQNDIDINIINILFIIYTI